MFLPKCQPPYTYCYMQCTRWAVVSFSGAYTVFRWFNFSLSLSPFLCFSFYLFSISFHLEVAIVTVSSGFDYVPVSTGGSIFFLLLTALLCSALLISGFIVTTKTKTTTTTCVPFGIEESMCFGTFLLFAAV